MPKDVIIACDFASASETMRFLEKFGEERPFVKIGMELYYGSGPAIVRTIKERGHKVFLDLKLHDIPNTVYKTMKVLADLDVDMCSCHAAGASEMMKAAARAFEERGKAPVLIAVTQLTSTDEEVMREEILIDRPLEEAVVSYALNAKASGMAGVVCSPQEAPMIHKACGDEFITVTPGIRFADDDKGDQVRVTTPAQARELGSDYIVVGRSITGSEDPAAAYRRCVSEFLGRKKEIAKSLLEIGAVFLRPEEPFTWASGIKSPIYCDNRLTLTAPKVRTMIEEEIAAVIKAEYPEAQVLMGTATAGIPHAAIAGHLLGLPMGYVRSGAKSHGRNNIIEGRIHEGQKAVVVEDLISTGGSAVQAAEALREAGCQVLGIVSIFTYGMKQGVERLTEAGIRNVSLCDLDTIAEVAAETGHISGDEIKKVLAFRDEVLQGGKE
ncbi:MAG: orotidine-5'-phosphate decarboxylase [Lentihominibacter sp.]|jgi:orotidine-5'-phosphate decarboxylase